MPNLRSSPHVAVAALTVDLVAGGNAPTEFRLLPLGRFRSADGSGRPLEVEGGWLLDAPGAARIAALSASRSSRRVIDFEHQTLRAAENGKPAPAAGWIGGLETRADGPYAVAVEWTAQAAQMIADKQYRYISPVFPYDKRTGAVLGVAHAALTNDPGLDGLTDLAGAAALSALFLEETPPMKALFAALGLSETATEAEALAALSAIKTAVPDPSKYVEIGVLTAKHAEHAQVASDLAEMRAKQHRAEVDAVIQAALAAGKLTPATEPHARKLADIGLADLAAFVAASVATVVPGTTQTSGVSVTAGKSHHSDADLAVMKALGLTAEQFAAGKHQEV